MRYSDLFVKTLKETPHDADNAATALLLRARFIEKEAAGIYSYLPMGLRVLRNIERVVREEMDAIGASEILMPGLTPREAWEQTGRWDTFDALYRLKSKNNQEFALGATHEEIVTPLMKKMIQSYRDLPAAVYQIQTKFRDETRAKSGLMRGREFLMKDLYSFHESDEDLDRYFEIVTDSYQRIFDRIGIGNITFKTYASGGAFTKYSLEFQTLTDAGEDEIYLDRTGAVAVNREIIEDEIDIAGFEKNNAEVEKASEVGNIFKLKAQFSVPFGLTFTNEEGLTKVVQMGCYGIGISRLMGVIAQVLHDERGLVWPTEIAPYQIHLVVLGKNEEARAVADALYASLNTKTSVLYDDRDEGAGAKLADADLFGIPYRVVISDKSLAAGGAEVKKRANEETKIVSISELESLFVNKK